MLSIIALTVLGVLGLQSFLVCVLLFIKARNVISNKLLALLILFLTFSYFNYFLSNILFLAGWGHVVPYLQVETLFGIGPALFLYTQSLVSDQFRLEKKHLLHFIPFAIEFLYYRTNIYAEGAIGIGSIPSTSLQYFYIVEQYAGLVSVAIYAFLALRLLDRYKNDLLSFYSSLDQHSIQWLLAPIIGFSIFWMSWLSTRLIDVFLFDDGLRTYYYLPTLMLLAVISGWIGLIGYFKNDT